MLALDKPYISSSTECDIQTREEFCLEYGTATQLYLVPYIRREEQVSHGFVCRMEYAILLKCWPG